MVELLREAAPSFVESEEFRRLDLTDHALPSVVLGAFTKYVERLNLEPPGAPSAVTAGDVDDALRAIEQLASSTDPEVVNALVVDVFEHLDLPDDLLYDFHARLGPSARDAYDRWIGAPGG